MKIVIQLLKQKFPKLIRQFNVYKNDILVAGTTIFETKYVAHSQYISGNDEKNPIVSRVSVVLRVAVLGIRPKEGLQP